MSDQDTPNEDDFEVDESTYGKLDRLVPKLIDQVDKMIDAGGASRPEKYRCETCGHNGYINVKMPDVQLLTRALGPIFGAYQKMQDKKTDDGSSGATKLLRDRSELTDAQLAEYIAKLEAELA